MRKITAIIFFVLLTQWVVAQNKMLDSMREVLRQDSIEYKKEMDEVEKEKWKTDSLIKKEIGAVPDISNKKPDTAAIAKSVRDYLAKKEQDEEEEQKDASIKVLIAFLLFIVPAIYFFKRNQFKQGR